MCQLFSPYNLFRSFEKFKRGKTNKIKLIEFSIDLEKNIFQLCKDINSGIYKPSKPRVFWVKDPKRRRIEAAPIRDRIVHHVLNSFLEKHLDKTLIYNSYGSRKNKGVLAATKRLNIYFRQESKNYSGKIYFLKCDIKKFFDNIDRDLLFSHLSNEINKINIEQNEKEMALKIIKKIIFFNNKNGLPIGNLTSQFFANFYLNGFDHYVKEKLGVKKYIRYMDDIICVSQNRDYLQSLIPFFKNYLSDNLKLELHPQKIKINSSRSGVDFLGYFLKPHYSIIRFKTRKRMIRMLKKTPDDKFANKFTGWYGYCKHANEYNFLKPYFKKLSLVSNKHILRTYF